MDITFVTDPKTEPPDRNKPYLAVVGPDGAEQWILLETDTADGVTDADFDFHRTDRGSKER